MYNYLQGMVVEIKPDHITLDVHDVGYQVFTPNAYEFHLNEPAKVFIHFYVREDAILLYGFKTDEAKQLFIKLLSVKGIGPKSAIAILATGNVQDVIGAIEIGNVKFLSKFPGIGPKASQQIILDLKGKLSFEEDRIPRHDNIREVEEALQSLGYKAKEIKKAVKHLDGSKPTEQLVKDALSQMLK
ncbi:Holliday junction branch migration protein RuvA [Candidatus Xianfuyuplasma coldseepsis]|uniref:Holliday junction branch migration complex subunit RuvA n=1 Tax=Candidatus Xianfuyuplasma coldseepsis TaxID=2782163 RepID=A0A7L7KVM2_9MOLU|nr:Holliday junction branch migration protein RuvA [Xianfuyuplasma coldseepsis]QMS85798.1 Holliday junction branch migration protein RuvA [Xianfuyuplasma coldseepsis]